MPSYTWKGKNRAGVAGLYGSLHPAQGNIDVLPRADDRHGVLGVRVSGAGFLDDVFQTLLIFLLVNHGGVLQYFLE